jgi:hypothetical protein
MTTIDFDLELTMPVRRFATEQDALDTVAFANEIGCGWTLTTKVGFLGGRKQMLTLTARAGNARARVLVETLAEQLGVRI